jgi:hypothetical protein
MRSARNSHHNDEPVTSNYPRKGKLEKTADLLTPAQPFFGNSGVNVREPGHP